MSRFSGLGGHHATVSATDTWLTPPDIIDALGGADSFDLDPCASIDQPWPTARQHLTANDNGLILRWFGRIWLNPPYSNPLLLRFLARMAEHNRGVALTFARTETVAFHKHVWTRAAGIMFLRGRLNFHDADGSRAKKNGGAPSVLIAYGEEDCEILANAPIDGHFVPLQLRSQVLVAALKCTWAEALDYFFKDSDELVHLGDLYRAFSRHPKIGSNKHWQAKLRQALQRGAYERVERGMWRRKQEDAA